MYLITDIWKFQKKKLKTSFNYDHKVITLSTPNYRQHFVTNLLQKSGNLQLNPWSLNIFLFF